MRRLRTFNGLSDFVLFFFSVERGLGLVYPPQYKHARKITRFSFYFACLEERNPSKLAGAAKQCFSYVVFAWEISQALIK